MKTVHFTRRSAVGRLVAGFLLCVFPKARSVAFEGDLEALGVATGRLNKIRALHLVVRNLSYAQAKVFIDRAKAARFNTIILGIAWRGSVALDSTPWVKKQDGVWTGETLRRITNYVRDSNMDAIPQLALLSKADNLFMNSDPALLYNTSTYDSRNERVYKKVFGIIDEVIEIMRPTVIHIGHDEVWGWRAKDYELKRLHPGERMLPADLFLEDVNKLHRYLKKRNIEVWMWGDMLISAEEFPGMKSNGALHSGIESFAYGRSLRGKISRDIVICDWHYRDTSPSFPTLRQFKEEGFRVLGATFDNMNTARKFSKYAAENGANGMIATTWYFVAKNDWETVGRIIDSSGEIFSEYF